MYAGVTGAFPVSVMLIFQPVYTKKTHCLIKKEKMNNQRTLHLSVPPEEKSINHFNNTARKSSPGRLRMARVYCKSTFEVI